MKFSSTLGLTRPFYRPAIAAVTALFRAIIARGCAVGAEVAISVAATVFAGTCRVRAVSGGPPILIAVLARRAFASGSALFVLRSSTWLPAALRRMAALAAFAVQASATARGIFLASIASATAAILATAPRITLFVFTRWLGRWRQVGDRLAKALGQAKLRRAHAC